MTSEPPSSEPPAAGGGHGLGGLLPVRALLVLAVFVVAVIALVAVGTRPSVSGDSAAVAPTTTTTTVAPTTTTTVPHSSVSVLVANATSQAGLAGHYSTVLTSAGWAVKTPVDAATTVSTSTVYYAAGQQASATAIASSLGLGATDVQPLTTATPVTGASGNDVVVVIGANLITQAGT
jgi:hypothetical protein